MTTNEDLSARRAAAVPRGVTSATAISVGRATNAHVWDVEGRAFIDFAAGIAVLNTGHRHPRVMAAVQDQLDRCTHVAFQVAAYESYIELAERLNGVAPIAGPAKTILFTTGAEAIENAVKIARAATGRSGLIAFSGGFHGRSALAMGLTGKVAPYKRRFGPPLPGIFHVPFPAQCFGANVQASLSAVDSIFRADIDPADVAAIVIEPVLGEGGFHQAPADLMNALRSICDTHGILLIADEVQTGFARTGRMFACEHYSVRPDLVTMAKSLAGGFPLSAVTGRAAIMDSVEPGGLGGTYGGFPVACAAALAVIDVIEEEGLCARAENLGQRAARRLEALKEGPSLAPLGQVRALGSMVGFDVVEGRGEAAQSSVTAKRVAAGALERGLIILTCGAFGETIRLLYPLTIEDETFEEGLNRLEAALADAGAA